MCVEHKWCKRCDNDIFWTRFATDCVVCRVNCRVFLLLSQESVVVCEVMVAIVVGFNWSVLTGEWYHHLWTNPLFPYNKKESVELLFVFLTRLRQLHFSRCRSVSWDSVTLESWQFIFCLCWFTTLTNLNQDKFKRWNKTSRLIKFGFNLINHPESKKNTKSRIHYQNISCLKLCPLNKQSSSNCSLFPLPNTSR